MPAVREALGVQPRVGVAGEEPVRGLGELGLKEQGEQRDQAGRPDPGQGEVPARDGFGIYERRVPVLPVQLRQAQVQVQPREDPVEPAHRAREITVLS